MQLGKEKAVPFKETADDGFRSLCLVEIECIVAFRLFSGLFVLILRRGDSQGLQISKTFDNPS